MRNDTYLIDNLIQFLQLIFNALEIVTGKFIIKFRFWTEKNIVCKNYTLFFLDKNDDLVYA